ncbi:MAG TPA: hypothetical protein VFV01_36515 [Spirillospora sp.]|nr:hypothetical protein [Spirillospora sp.]
MPAHGRPARSAGRAVVWRRDATDPVLRDFVRACVEAAAGERAGRGGTA